MATYHVRIATPEDTSTERCGDIPAQTPELGLYPHRSINCVQKPLSILSILTSRQLSTHVSELISKHTPVLKEVASRASRHACGLTLHSASAGDLHDKGNQPAIIEPLHFYHADKLHCQNMLSPVLAAVQLPSHAALKPFRPGLLPTP